MAFACSCAITWPQGHLRTKHAEENLELQPFSSHPFGWCLCHGKHGREDFRVPELTEADISHLGIFMHLGISDLSFAGCARLSRIDGCCRTAEDIEDVRREVQIMHHLKGHENICLLHAAYEDKHHVHLVRPA